jgi:hypothetical protein
MSEKKEEQFAFARINYILFGISAAIIVIGYLLMLGGGSEDPTVFNYDELFSFRRITLAPIVVLIGFALAVYAILKKSDQESNS